MNASANGLVLNSLVSPATSKLTPSFMLTVLISTSCVVSIVDTQLCTLTLKRKGPFGEEQVPVT